MKLEIPNVHVFVFDCCPVSVSICKCNQIHVRCVYQQNAKDSLKLYDWLKCQNRMFIHTYGKVSIGQALSISTATIGLQ